MAPTTPSASTLPSVRATTTTRPSRSSTVSSATSESSDSFHILPSDSGNHSDSEDEIVWSLAGSVISQDGIGSGGIGSVPSVAVGALGGGGQEEPDSDSSSLAYHSLASDDEDDFVVLSRRGRGAGMDTPVEVQAITLPVPTTTPASLLQSRLENLTLRDDGAPVHAPGGSGRVPSHHDAQIGAGTIIVQKADAKKEPIIDAGTTRKEDHDVQAQLDRDAQLSLPTPDGTPKRERKPATSAQPSIGSLAPSMSANATQGLANPILVVSASAPVAHISTKIKKKKKGKKSKAKKRSARASANDGASPNAQTTLGGEGQTKKSKKKQKGSAVAAVAPSSTKATSTDIDPSLFKEASDYISSFLSSPEARTNAICKLTLLQSLIVELGLVSSALSLPASLKSARTFLKTRAFLNIKEYLSVREQGQEAIRKLLYPSRMALVRDIRRRRKDRVSLSWVKEHGLQVLLVGCHFH